MRADFWTRERIAMLKQLWAEGKTAGAIAKELGGISRSAVLGKIFRLRLGAAKKPKETARQAAKAVDQKPSRAQDRPAPRRGVEPQTTATASRAARRKSLFELTNRCCRWPHGQPGTKNFFFCGASGADVENGLPYCPLHMKRAYIVAPDNAVKTSLKTGLTTSLTPWRVVSRAA